jgi:hypothetical protein
MLLGGVKSELGRESIGSMLLPHATAAKAWQPDIRCHDFMNGLIGGF